MDKVNVKHGQGKCSFDDAFRFLHHLFCIFIYLIRQDKQTKSEGFRLMDGINQLPYFLK